MTATETRTAPKPIKLSKPMRAAIDSAETCESSEIKLGRKWVPTTVQRITCAPSTYKVLARLGLVGPAVNSFRLLPEKEERP